MKVKGGAKRRNLGDGTDGGSESGVMDESANVDGSVIGDVGIVGNGEEKVPSAEDVVEGGEEEGEGEGDEEEGEGEREGEEEEEEYNGGEQRPKLAEGFHEIEAVRRRRVRKGEVQYLIKWRGWPETANTWEPLANLSSCVDVVEAFEERLQLGNSRSSRKRKRKHGNVIPHTQPRKKHQSQSSRSTFTASDSDPIENGVNNNFPTSLRNSTILEDAVPLQTVHFGLNEVTKSDSRDLVPEQSVEKVAQDSSRPFSMREEESGYDPKLSELRGGTCSNGFTKDSSTRNFREAKGSGGDEPSGTTRIGSVEPGQSARQVGSRKRKCNSVKRFKQETAANSSTAHIGFSTTAYNMKTETNSEKSSPIITKIIKPIGFSASIANNIQDVSVTFMAMRSDGKEVMVDNNFLKANYPLLVDDYPNRELIDFYEQHLRYSPTS